MNGRMICCEKRVEGVTGYNMLENDALVSIIMPVYNAERFIRNTILGIDAQTYKNIELIVINDGSKDATQKVLDEIAQQEKLSIQLRVFQQENMGICHTRNKGMELARGKYIAFVDHDDSMPVHAIENLVNKAEKTQADMVIGGYALVDKDGKILENCILDENDPWSLFRINAPWGRIFRKEVIDENHISFFITKISEDFYFNYLFMSYARKIEILPDVSYRWLYSETSESHANMSQFSEDRDVLAMLTALMEDMNRENSLDKEYLEYGLIKHVIWYMFYISKSVSKELLTQIYKRCILWLERYCPEYKKNSLLKWGRPKSEGFSQKLVVKVAVVLERMKLLNVFLHVYAGKVF